MIKNKNNMETFHKKTENENFQSQFRKAEKAILSFKEALVYLDISSSSLYKLTSQRAIRYFKPNGGKIYFKKIDLDNWMLQNENNSLSNIENELILKISENGRRN